MTNRPFNEAIFIFSLKNCANVCTIHLNLISLHRVFHGIRFKVM